MYLIKNSLELAKYIEYTNLSNIATEEEIKAFLDKAKEYTFQSVVVSPTYFGKILYFSGRVFSV